MHGIIFSELRKYVDTKLGSGAWNQLLAAADMEGRMYLPIQEYPDSDMVELVGTAARITGLPATAILEDFGEFIAPALLGLYRTLVQPEWKTLDLLESTEQTIHSVVRARNPGAKPAELHTVRVGPEEVELTYTSKRRLCAVAKGILRGIAVHYEEQLSIVEHACMHDGADACRMSVRVGAAAAAGAREETKSTKKLSPKKPAAKKSTAKAVPSTKATSRKASPRKRATTAQGAKLTSQLKQPSAAKPPSSQKNGRAAKVVKTTT